MDARRYIVGGVVPAYIEVMEPMSEKAGEPVQYTQGEMFAELVREDKSYAGRLLSAASDVYSKWFSVMKSAISRERVRERLELEESGRSVMSKVPYERPVLTALEESTVAVCESIVRSLFDPKVSEYAVMKFRKAMDTGDKRSFKIRLLVLKSRDSLKGTPLYKGFSEGADECISKAERLAGCIPDPSPRRMSRSEKARAMERKAIANSPTLFRLDEANNQYIDTVNNDGNRESAPADTVSDPGHAECHEGSEAGSAGDASSHPQSKVQYIDSRAVGDWVSKKTGNRSKPKVIKKDNVTVTVTVTNKDNSFPKRKTRTYTNVSEILSDIESGAIVAYLSSEEVICDVRNGRITPAEAVLFLSELTGRKRSESSMVCIGEEVSMDIDSKLGVVSDEEYAGRMSIPGVEEDDVAGDSENDEDQDEMDGDSRDDKEMYGGYRSSGAEWCPDDDM